MRVILLILAICFAGCGKSSSRPKAEAVKEPVDAKPDREPVRRALANIHSYLGDLEDRVRISKATTWDREASAAQHDLGNIQIEVDKLRRASVDVGNLEGLLSDLDGRLRAANSDNWDANASAAQHIVGSIRIELGKLGKGW